MRVPRLSVLRSTSLAAAGLVVLTVAACGAATGGTTGGLGSSPPPGSAPASSLTPGSVGDCPLPSSASSTTTTSGASTTSPSLGTATASTGVIGPGTMVTSATESLPSVASAVPGHPGLMLPSPAPIAGGDVTAVVGNGPQAVALHVGRRLTLLFPAAQAVTVPSDPDPAVLRSEGRVCEADGTAVFGYATLRPGEVVFILLPGPRCLHGHPACLPAQREEPLRVGVVP